MVKIKEKGKEIADIAENEEVAFWKKLKENLEEERKQLNHQLDLNFFMLDNIDEKIEEVEFETKNVNK